MAGNGLSGEGLTPNPNFNWHFLLELIVSSILVLFFLFYFNRLVATIVSYAIRAFTWHYYRAYVDIGSIQVSLLGGRIFFKDIRYHGVNETVLIHGGFITWNYWTRAVERNDLPLPGHNKPTGKPSHYGSDAEALGSQRRSGAGGNAELGASQGKADLPRRIGIRIFGLEWFIYNRTPAYDGILAGFDEISPRQKPQEDVPDSCRSSGSMRRPKDGRDENDTSLDGTSRPRISPAKESYQKNKVDAPSEAVAAPVEVDETTSRLIQLFPLGLECSKGAIVVGNEHTRSVLTATFHSALGTIDACGAGSLDLYRQIFSFDFQHPVIQLRPNPDFKQSQLSSTGLSSKQDDRTHSKRKRELLFNYHFQKRRVWHSIRDLIPWFQSSVESFHFPQQARDHEYLSPHQWAGASGNVRWAGLSRYLDESVQDDHEGWTDVEYGRFSTIVDSPAMSLSYYWDIPGRVTLRDADRASTTSEGSAKINGALPPQWGMDIQLKGGSINYGPWADRERAGLQNVFFPNFFRDSQAALPLAPGQTRQSTAFTLRLEVTEETILRIPTREPSKDWLWKGRAQPKKGTSKTKNQPQKGNRRRKDGEKSGIGPDLRPFGWLSISIGPDSTVRYSMDMVASQSGYKNTLMLDIRHSRLSSSVNHGLLWQCPRQLLTCDLSNPLEWNTLRTWVFDVESHDMELFLLRDHLFLITDLVSDWASGPSPDYWTFVPYVYKLNLAFRDVRLCINVNDRNIISNPTDKDDNSFLVIKAESLTSDVRIPLDSYRPESNGVDFHVNLQEGGIDLTTPVWDTLHTFLRDKSTALLEKLVIDGRYHYFQSTSSELTDTLTLDFAGVSPRLYLYGFLIRYFMTITHNYFGDEMHFRTLEEYQERAYAAERVAEISGINPNRKSNDLDVIIHATVESPCAVLPENIYEHVKAIRLSAATLEIDVRFTNYYMDLSGTISPVKAALESQHVDGSTTLSGTQLFVDQVSVHGHRLFGLPPSEPTYVCNWDFGIGRVVGECSTEFLSCLLAAVQTFDLTFDNFENALLPLTPFILHDVTFLRADIRSLQVSLLVNQGALIISTGAIKARFNDWANRRFSKRLGLSIPDITVAAVDCQAIREFQVSRKPVDPLALFEFTVELKMAQRKSTFFEHRRLQQAHVRVHDQRTQRAPWLLLELDDDEAEVLSLDATSFDLPNLPVPAMPAPVTNIPGSSDRYLRVEEALPEGECKVGIGGGGSNSVHTVASDGHVDSETEFLAGKCNREDAELIASKSTILTRIRHDPAVSVGVDISAEASDANPWSFPRFSLAEIVLNKRDFPPQQASVIMGLGKPTSEKPDAIMSQSEEDGMSHVNLSIALPAGVFGLCTPGFLILVSTMFRELQPAHPVEILDSLQKSVVSDLVGYEKALRSPKTSTNLAVRVPLIMLNLVNYSSPDDHDLSPSEFKDDYHLQISRLRTEFQARVERRPGDLLGKIKKEHTIRAAVDDLSISMHGGSTNAVGGHADLKCILSDTSLWIVSNARLRSGLQVRAVDFLTATKSAEEFALLVRRTTSMTDSVASAFTVTSSLSSDRLRYLVFSLTQSAAQVSDPAFLTRVSSVLRLAPAHLRQHDSWKIISRLRNIYNNMPTSKHNELISKLSGDDLVLPANAQSVVLSNFDQWRAWDLAHVAKSYAMRVVWGVLHDVPEEESSATFVSCAIERLRIAVDPGPHVNDLVVEDISTTLAATPQTGRTEPRRKIFALQSYCSSTSLNLRWEILELVEGIAKVMSSVDLNASAASKSRVEPAKSSESELHVILGADDGSITLDGINVKLALAGKGLRASFVRGSEAVENATSLSLLLTAQTCSSEITSYERSLLVSELWQPNFYLSATSRMSTQHMEQDFRIAGSCKRLRFDMMEGPLYLAETADRLIEDEVRQIHHLVKGLDLPTAQVGTQVEAKTSKTVRFGLALFLDDYRLSLQILPSLTYIVSGEVARMSLSPQGTSRFEIDFDVKGNSHAFMSAERGRWTTLSVLEIPPINGRLLARTLPSRTEIDLDVSVEMIHLEASAVRSLLGALTRPEIARLVSDLQRNVEILEHRCKDVLHIETVPAKDRKPSTGHLFVYKGSLTMAGMQIHAMAPGLSGTDYEADMCLSLGLVQAHIDNGLAEPHPMEYPSFHVEITRIALDLQKKSPSESRSYGRFAVDARITAGSALGMHGEALRSYDFRSQGFQVELYSETTSLVVDILAHLQERLKTLDLSEEVKRLAKIRHKPSQNPLGAASTPRIQVNDEEPTSQDIFNAMYSVELNNIEIGWNMAEDDASERRGRQGEDLVFSIRRLDLSNKKRNAAKLKIEDMLLHMVPFADDRRKRSLNSALMPELVFNVAYSSGVNELRLAFQAAGKSLDIRATPEFILPASMVRQSMARASKHLRNANAIWMTAPSTDNKVKQNLFGNKRIGSVLVDVDFAGATVSLLGASGRAQQTTFAFPFQGSRTAAGKYGQYLRSDDVTTATFRAPGVAWKVLFEDNGRDDPVLNAELKIDASSNTIYPSLVPLIKQMSATIKETMGDEQAASSHSSVRSQSQSFFQETSLNANTADTILGRCRVNMGLLIMKQEFSLSCQPISRVAATARFESIYVSVNSVLGEGNGRFLALSMAFDSLQASVRHVYSSEPTASFEVKAIIVSLMNSRHFSNASGISAIVKMSPMSVSLNAKQVQDLLLFREIWLQPDEEMPAAPTLQAPPSDSQAFTVQRYQQVAAATAFPWNSTVAITRMEIHLDLGPTLGRSKFQINDMWVSSKKSSDWEQSLCIGLHSVEVDSQGRMSGFLGLSQLKVSTSIKWSDEAPLSGQTPLIEASIAFGQLQAKASFDYQPFLVTNVEKFEFLMYNVRDGTTGCQEHLFSILEGDTVQVFCTSLTASQALALVQAWQRLVQDKRAAYEASLRELERFLRRKPSLLPDKIELQSSNDSKPEGDPAEAAPISLRTEVVVSIRRVNVGAFPSSFYDHQIFKLDALDAQARFAVAFEDNKIHSALGLTLGQLRVELSGVSGPKTINPDDLAIDEVVRRAVSARGGTILQVPRLVAGMETWQSPGSRHIDYIYKSTFEGKVDVGWNYSRISFIRDMWETHSRALATRLGKPLAPLAVRITSGPGAEGDSRRDSSDQQEKITAVVNVPQSKYTYTALEPPVIETPQLRDMGEATPPLEWIGLHRERLPNVTHQIIIVTLLEIAKEVEDAYEKILGSS